jgi:hypothetical protein
LEAQVVPAFVEVKMGPNHPFAMSVFPSADEATEYQFPSGIACWTQVAPEFEEV